MLTLFLADDGGSAVEYGILAVVVAAVCVGAIAIIGQKVLDLYYAASLPF